MLNTLFIIMFTWIIAEEYAFYVNFLANRLHVVIMSHFSLRKKEDDQTSRECEQVFVNKSFFSH